MSDEKPQVRRDLAQLEANEVIKPIATVDHSPNNCRKTMKLTTIQLSHILENCSPRSTQESEDEAILKNHLKKGGYFTPPEVEQQADGMYRIIAGHRTVVAAKLLEWKTLPVYLINSSIAVSNSRLSILIGCGHSSDELTTSYPQKQFLAEEIENG